MLITWISVMQLDRKALVKEPHYQKRRIVSRTSLIARRKEFRANKLLVKYFIQISTAMNKNNIFFAFARYFAQALSK